MRALTVILAYYMNRGMLAKQYECFAALPDPIKSQLTLIVVDDGSPKSPAFHCDIGMPVEVYRILVDVRWNQDAARNLGVHQSDTRWLLLTDIDHLIPEATLERLLNGEFDKQSVYRFSRVSAPKLDPYKPHPNSWFMTRKMYDAIGGYDERLAGYYGSDADFRNRVSAQADSVDILPEVLIRVPREVIADASTTTYGRKEPQDRIHIPLIIKARKNVTNWRPKRLSFPWRRVA